MGRVVPFSEIDIILTKIQSPVGCIVDTQLLIASLYEPHPFNEDAEFIYEKLAEYGVPIFSNVTVRHEFIDVTRRTTMTEKALSMITPQSKWRITNEAKFEIGRIKSRLDGRAASNEVPLLTDREIKILKKMFSPITQSGKDGWLELCTEFFGGKLQSAWDQLADDLVINYIDMQDVETQKLFHDKVSWDKMCKISEISCLGSSDSMILNALNCSTLDFLVSADFDLAYAVMVGSTEKTVLVPDPLYRRELKVFQKWVERN